MAKPTISEVLDRLEKNEQRNAALFSGIIDRLGELSEAVKPKAETKILVTEAPIKDEPKAPEAENPFLVAIRDEYRGGDMVTGKIKRMAFHQAGLLLEGNSKWFNAAKGSKLFKNFVVGDEVTLTMDGDVVTSIIGEGGTVAITAPKEVVRTESKSTEGGCEFCGGSAHRHVSTIGVQSECLNRQYQAGSFAGANFKFPDTIRELVDWMENNDIKFAGMGAAPKAEAPKAEAPKETEQKQDAPKEQRQFSGRRFSGRRSSGAPKEKELEATVTGGTYQGFINRIGQTPETAHMVRIVSSEHQGPKGEGVWFSATKELLAGRSIGDRVSYVLDGRDKNLGKLIGLTLLGSVEKDTGHKEGVKGSGKQQAPAPKGQPKDEVVAAGSEGAAAKAKKIQERRSRMAAANKSAA